MNSSGIYAIVAPSNSAYIGSSKRLARREQDHFQMLRRQKHHCAALQNAWNKYGDTLRFVVIEHCPIDMLITREQWWIDNAHLFWVKRYNSSVEAHRIVRTPEGQARVTEAIRNRVHSVDSRVRMSESQQQRFSTMGVSQETRRKLGDARRGRPHTPETVEKLRYEKTPAHREALSKAHAGKKKKPHSEEAKARHTARIKARWADPSFRSKIEEKKITKHIEMLNWIVGG